MAAVFCCVSVKVCAGEYRYSAGLFNSFTYNGAEFCIIAGEDGSFHQLQLITDFARVIRNVSLPIGYGAAYSYCKVLFSKKSEEGRTVLYAGPGVLCGKFQDTGDKLYRTAGLSLTGGLEFISGRGLSVGLSLTPVFGINIVDTDEYGVMDLYKWGAAQGISPRITVRRYF